jgi:hypothetical protein
MLTDLAPPLYIRYAKRVTDPNAMDPLFREAFACRLAAEACESLTQSATKRQGRMGRARSGDHRSDPRQRNRAPVAAARRRRMARIA